jgi:hypothetical protein
MTLRSLEGSFEASAALRHLRKAEDGMIRLLIASGGRRIVRSASA